MTRMQVVTFKVEAGGRQSEDGCGYEYEGNDKMDLE